MAKKLLNEFSWSFSRYTTFCECQKRYWYNYYGSWEGWPKTPFDERKEIDPLAAHLYMLKAIQPMTFFLGSTVHKVIERQFKQNMGVSQRELPSQDELVAQGQTLLLKGIEDSKSGAWKESPKKFANLAEHYFSDGKSDPFPKAKLDEYLDKVKVCLSNWLASPVAKMAFSPQAEWLSVEELSHFMLEGFKIIVVIDFAMKWKGKEETTILFDWKTGQESEKNEAQLYSYALFAKKAMGVPYDKLILSPFYLFLNKYVKIGTPERPIVEENLIQLQQEIVASCKTMTEKLGANPLEKPDPTTFRYPENKKRCHYCSYKNLCQKVNFKDATIDELRDSVMKKECVPVL